MIVRVISIIKVLVRLRPDEYSRFFFVVKKLTYKGLETGDHGKLHPTVQVYELNNFLRSKVFNYQLICLLIAVDFLGFLLF